MTIPSGHQVVMPYLMLQDAARFISFTTSVFGARLTVQNRNDSGNLMHAELQIGECTIMFTEATEQWPPQTANLFVYVPDADAAYAGALEAGAASVMELSDQDYGRTCGVKDPTGNTWWITAV